MAIREDGKDGPDIRRYAAILLTALIGELRIHESYSAAGGCGCKRIRNLWKTEDRIPEKMRKGRAERKDMSILKLEPAVKDYLWGGHRLVEEYHVNYSGPVCAEAWVLSCHPDGPSVIASGEYKGKTLPEYIREKGKELLGSSCRRSEYFPILTKLIDAKENLSIQVHPDDAYALKHEGQYGKTEMWYILDAEPGAFLYYGFRRELSLEEFEERIRNNTLLEVLHKLYVKRGDSVFIEAGTLHAIGKGILLAEIQQNSNVTYRVYDYGRIGKDGRQRELHIRQAKDVTRRLPPSRRETDYPHVADCGYFTVDRLFLDGEHSAKISGTVDSTSFLHILILDGEGRISCGEDAMPYQKGDSFFLPASSASWTLEGSCDALLSFVRPEN